MSQRTTKVVKDMQRKLILILAIILIMGLAGTAFGSAPIITAHRGASSLAPENTLAAVQKALELGVPWIEVDVHRTRDRVLVVLHDETVDRTTNGTGPINQLTYAEVAKLDAGSWFSPEFSGEPIPTLEEVLLACRGQATVLIELKGTLTERPTIELVRELEMEDQVVIQSFDHIMVGKAKQRAPEIPAFILIRQDLTPQAMVNTALYYGANGIGVRHNFLTEELVEVAHENGLVVFPWTVDNPEDMLNYLQMGVDGIITNYPQVLQEILTN